MTKGRTPTTESKPITMLDVARHAGVSLATVSRVVNGVSSVDPVLANRVRKSVSALDYSANPLARSLVSGKTQTISVIVPDLGNPTFQAILRGLSHAAARDDYHVLIADSAEVVEEEYLLAMASRRRTDGIILCAPRMPEEQLAALIPLIEPVVLINRDPRLGTAVVAADYRAGLHELLDHLYDLGHRHLCYLAGASRSSSNISRLAALAEFRVLHPDVVIDEVPCGFDFEAGAAAARNAVATRATAIVAYNDLVAMGLLNAIEGLGQRVPEDISIVGFDGIPFSAYTSPPLTTMSVPADELGEQAWSGMTRLLSHRDAAHSIYLRPRIEVRGSTGRAPEKALPPGRPGGPDPLVRRQRPAR